MIINTFLSLGYQIREVIHQFDDSGRVSRIRYIILHPNSARIDKEELVKLLAQKTVWDIKIKTLSIHKVEVILRAPHTILS